MNKKRVVSLVLAGGGSLGSYEVGAIKALKEMGYTFDIVCGTSIGGLNGAFVAADQMEKCEQLWLNITPEKVMVNGINITKQIIESQANGFNTVAAWTSTYFKNKMSADITPFKEYIKAAVDIDAVYNSPIKFGVVTTKFPSMLCYDVDMKKVKREEFLPFLHATSACAPVFPREKIGKQLYIDGFYNDNLPIRLAFNYGAKEVIAIDMKLFQLKPRHSFFIKLPNVHYIAPFINLGSMLDFSQEPIQRNMILGYLDAKKYFKEYRGFKYCLKGEIDSEGFMVKILSRYSTDCEYIVKRLNQKIDREMDETDYFVSAIESLAELVKFENYYTAYTLDEFTRILEIKVNDRLDQYEEEARNSGSIKKTINQLIESLDSKSNRVWMNFMTYFAFEVLGIKDRKVREYIDIPKLIG